MLKYYIALGSNMGDKENYLKQALEKIKENELIELVQVSSFLVTEPWGNVNQDKFVNAVCEIKTNLLPQELLKITQSIEKSCDRVRHEHWGPRTLDLDIIWCEDSCAIEINDENLKVPHPYFWERNFVLEPLAEINPNFTYKKKSILERISELK